MANVGGNQVSFFHGPQQVFAKFGIGLVPGTRNLRIPVGKKLADVEFRMLRVDPLGNSVCDQRQHLLPILVDVVGHKIDALAPGTKGLFGIGVAEQFGDHPLGRLQRIHRKPSYPKVKRRRG